MTYHVITLMTHGARLSVDRGFLVCKYPDENENRTAISDIRALILATPKIGFSAEAMSRLLEQDSVILHCNNEYQAIGWTVSLERVIKKEAFYNQIVNDECFNQELWKLVLRQKIANQIYLLDTVSAKHTLHKHLEEGAPLDEANVARGYWDNYFTSLGHKQIRERQGAQSFENKALNYGYAVISTLVHRAVLIHGLLPSLGIHHKARYRNSPLVYDLMEPFRPFVDYILYYWTKVSLEYEKTDEKRQWNSWVVFLMNSLRNCRIKKLEEKHSHKLVDAIDISITSIANTFSRYSLDEASVSKLWLPDFHDHYWVNKDEE